MEPSKPPNPKPFLPTPTITSERDLLHSPSPSTPQAKAPPKPLKSSLKRPDTPTTTKKVSFDAPVTPAEHYRDMRARFSMMTTHNTQLSVYKASMPPYTMQENDKYWSALSALNDAIGEQEKSQELIERMRRRRTRSERDEDNEQKKQERDEQRGVWTKLPGVKGDYETLCLDEKEEEDWDISGRHKMPEWTNAKSERQKIINVQLEIMKKALAEGGMGRDGIGASPVWKTYNRPPVATTERQMVRREGGAKENRRLVRGGQRGVEDRVKDAVKDVAKEVGKSRWWKDVLWPSQNDDEDEGKKENSDGGMAGDGSAGGTTIANDAPMNTCLRKQLKPEVSSAISRSMGQTKGV